MQAANRIVPKVVVYAAIAYAVAVVNEEGLHKAARAFVPNAAWVWVASLPLHSLNERRAVAFPLDGQDAGEVLRILGALPRDLTVLWCSHLVLPV